MSKTIIRYVCKYCKNSYDLPTELIRHKKQEHAEEVAKILARFRTDREEKENNSIDRDDKEQKVMVKPSVGDEGNNTFDHQRIRSDIDPMKEEEVDRPEPKPPLMSPHGANDATKINPFQCRFCKKILRRIAERILHEKVHTGEKPYKCKACRKAFVWKCSLDRHLKNNKCGSGNPATDSVSVGSRRLVIKTMSLREAGDEPKSTVVAVSDTVDEPLAAFSNSKSKLRSPKKRRRSAKINIRKYIEHKLENGQRIYKCIFCLKESKTIPDAIRHGTTHRSTESVRCSYPNCNATYTRMDTLECHIGRCHTGDMPFKCSYCNQLYPTKTGLRRHHRNSKTCPSLKTKLRDKKKKVRNLSPKRSKKVLPALIRIKKRNPQLQPDFSSDSNPTASLVNSYLTVQVINGRPEYTCTFCEAKFSTGGGYGIAKNHIYGHIKPFKCSYCGKRFARRESRLSHETIHTGEKLFTCNICGKSYRWPSGARGCRRSHPSNGKAI